MFGVVIRKVLKSNLKLHKHFVMDVHAIDVTINKHFKRTLKCHCEIFLKFLLKNRPFLKKRGVAFHGLT